jgi:hypothetical protein
MCYTVPAIISEKHVAWRKQEPGATEVGRWGLLPLCFSHMSCSIYSASLKNEATSLTGKSVEIQRATGSYTPEDT